MPTLVATPINYHTPYTQQYSLDVQQQLSPTLLLDISYVGNHSTHLLGQIDINEIMPGAFAATGQFNATIAAGGFGTSTSERPLNQIRPYKGYGPINAIESIFSSNYNSLQVHAEKRLAGNSYFAANYTFSRALTNNQSDRSTAPQNTYNIAGEYGRSALDRTNILTLNGVWDLPFFHDQKGLVGRLIGGWENFWYLRCQLRLAADCADDRQPDSARWLKSRGCGWSRHHRNIVCQPAAQPGPQTPTQAMDRP